MGEVCSGEELEEAEDDIDEEILSEELEINLLAANYMDDILDMVISCKNIP